MEVDGLKLAPLLRERSHSYVPIVFLTGRDDDQAREETQTVRRRELLVRAPTIVLAKRAQQHVGDAVGGLVDVE